MRNYAFPLCPEYSTKARKKLHSVNETSFSVNEMQFSGFYDTPSGIRISAVNPPSSLSAEKRPPYF